MIEITRRGLPRRPWSSFFSARQPDFSDHEVIGRNVAGGVLRASKTLFDEIVSDTILLTPHADDVEKTRLRGL